MIDLAGSDIVRAYRASALARRIASIDMVLTITSGRSGTRLLAKLCSEVLGIEADHEPEPRANFALRPTIEDPRYGLRWLVDHKLPAIAERARESRYVETSHLYGKAFVELFAILGVKPRYIILRFDARTVARSLFAIDGIPERSITGRQVLVGPTDPVLLPLAHWDSYTDYQLCYWYAREMIARQDRYASYFAEHGLACTECRLEDLLEWEAFARISTFITGNAPQGRNESTFCAIVGQNQNPRHGLLGDRPERPLPEDPAREEAAIDAALAAEPGAASL